MDNTIKTYFTQLEEKDRNQQYEAYQHLIAEMKSEVDWAYDVWDQLVEDLTDNDAHKRSRAAQFLSYLAISDRENRILEDFEKVWQVTYDDKFVTARHTLQVIWRIGLAGEKQELLVIDALATRYKTCTDEKNYTLIRNDIIQNLHHFYLETQIENIKHIAMELIELENDPKYQKKYKKIWK
ncbi:hypothetical protein GI584_07135 [Gracilibacillus salitolerans]|uniref:HEAT repeat domain-containing protein n=1 Tax=Gracilibacillus salitolerans TaxID=2663022 RepID=A0A5Q2TGP7_9BACI|nr:hypothetical protein [Gracilibacillus salitolerans]QGH33805.1 hypothetical protein GI584_07135 [Gracilibacillus salitolerans]